MPIIFEDEYESSTYDVDEVLKPWDNKNGLNALDVAGLAAVAKPSDPAQSSHFWSEFEDVIEMLAGHGEVQAAIEQGGSLLF